MKFPRLHILVILTALFLLWFTTSVLAHIEPKQCQSVEMMHELITEKYGEELIYIGLIPSEIDVVEIWLNPITGSMSVIQVTPFGQACMMAGGTVAYVGSPKGTFH